MRGSMSIDEASKIFHIPKGKIYHGLKKLSAGVNPFLDFRGKERLLHDHHHRFIKEIFLKGQVLLLSAGKIKKLLLDKFDDIPENISESTIRSYLKRWGFSYKEVKIRSNKVDEDRINHLKLEFCMKISRSLKIADHIIFVDESSFQI